MLNLHSDTDLHVFLSGATTLRLCRWNAEMIRYALTGSTGLLGTALTQVSKPENIYTGDIRAYENVSCWINGIKDVDAIIHLAALVPKQIVDLEPRKAFEINVGGTINILESLRRMRALGQKTPWLFYASTSHVYAPSHNPIKEDATRDPFTLYGMTKLQGEQWCEAFARDFDISLCIGRIFSFSGQQQPDYYFLPAMFKKIREAEKGATLKILGVQGYRDFLRVPQICETIFALGEKKYEGSVNIGTGQAHKLSDLVLKVATRLGREDLKFEFPEGSTEALVANNELLHRLGVSMSCDIDRLIDEMVST